MSVARLQTKQFSSAEDLCRFVNSNDITVIVSIVIHDDMYKLFYR